MKIKGKKRLVKQAICFAQALGINNFKLTITREEGSSFCSRYEDGSFLINVGPLDKYWAGVHLAHEMVHLKQYKRDELVGDCEEGITYWKGEKYFPVRHETDAYFLAPWEMEARALEDWLMHKWRTRDRELH